MKYKNEPVLISGSINSRGGMSFKSDLIPKSNIGTEYTYSFWIYPAGWDYKYGKPKHVLSRGSDPRKIDEAMVFNPGVWFYPENSNLLIRFDTYGQDNTFIKQENKVLNYVVSEENLEENADVENNIVYNDISANECKEKCFKNENCSGISIDKNSNTCHLKTSGDSYSEPNKNYDSYIKSSSMNPYQLGPDNFNPNLDCDLLEIPLQRWSHVVITLWNRTTDVYLNGKLVRSCILKNVPKIPHSDPLYVCQDGGYDGKFSQLRYFNRALNADEAYYLYSEGPSSCNFIGNDQVVQKKK
jgi:hypothetical protein